MKVLLMWVLLCLPLAWAETQYTNQFVAEIQGGEAVARNVSESLGYTYKGPAPGFENFYLMTYEGLPEVYEESQKDVIPPTRLDTLPEVQWAEQLTMVTRSKRSVPLKWNGGKSHLTGQRTQHTRFGRSDSVVNCTLVDSYKSNLSTKPYPASSLNTYQGPTKSVELLSNKTSFYKDMFKDPLWPQQWYLQDYRTEDMPVMDLNVVPVWKQCITGKGIIVAVVDDGVKNNLSDLQGNFDFDLSYDIADDIPGSEPKAGDSHGTLCAGVIGMVANNTMCGVGVAYNATLIGIRVFGEMSTTLVEARGLSYRLDKVDIYSNSWGPVDNGNTWEQFDRMVTLAIKKGVTEGRSGKGAIYLFAAGNGRGNNDNCAYDGYVNSPNTISITSVTQRGKITSYSERCTAVFAAAYSGDDGGEGVISTVLDNTCTTTFSGTSAATPLASGIVALTLSANSNLTERDIKHIITMGAEVAPVANNNGSWYKNGRGFWVSNDFGFGLLNAENMVNLAKTWTNVPEKHECIHNFTLQNTQNISTGETTTITFSTQGCQDSNKTAVQYLEQIEVASEIDYPYRGALSINLTSPAGTKSALLEPRINDSATTGLNILSIKSVHNWGENPRGLWIIEVKPVVIEGVNNSMGAVRSFKFTFHGTAERPAHYVNTPRSYSAFRLPDGRTSAS